MQGLVAINGEVYPIEQARIPVTDRAFLFGDGLVETIGVVDSRIIDCDAHLHRLRRSAEACHINIPWPDSLLRFEMDSLLSLTRFARSSLRLLISRGLSASLKPTGSEVSQRYLFCAAASPMAVKEEGLRLKAKRDPLNRRGPLHKSPSYLHAIVAGIECQSEVFDDILWINSDGEITEAASANIFLLAREGDLLEIATPPVQSGILPGVTRSRLISLLQSSMIPVTERTIAVEELPRFDEAFLCSSVRGLVPIQSIDRHRLHSCRPTAIFHEIHRLYNSWESHEESASDSSESGH